MIFLRPQREVFIFVASSGIAIVLIILACCHRIKKRWLQESGEYEKSNPKSRITEDSESDAAAVQVRLDITRKANINEGYTVDVVDNGTEISSAENGKDDGQVLNRPHNNEEGVKGLTHVNHDGSMDTRF